MEKGGKGKKRGEKTVKRKYVSHQHFPHCGLGCLLQGVANGLGEGSGGGKKKSGFRSLRLIELSPSLMPQMTVGKGSGNGGGKEGEKGGRE